MTKKISEMLRSGDPEMRNLGMEACRVENPMVWAALMGFNGSSISDETIALVAKNSHMYIGAKVKYKGMEKCPMMVVSSVLIQPIQNMAAGIRNGGITNNSNPGFCLLITAKYYNKSTQSFCQTQDRIECFEIINEKREI